MSTLTNLTPEDWTHIHETAQQQLDDLNNEDDSDGGFVEMPEEEIVTSIGYVRVGCDPYENTGWVEAYGERQEFDLEGP